MKIVLMLVLLAIMPFNVKGQMSPPKNEQFKGTLYFDDGLPIKSVQDSIAFELCQIFGLDQGIRQMNMGCGQSSIKIDSVNFSKMIDIIDKYGFPCEKTLGEYFRGECVTMAAIAVMLHNTHKMVKDRKIFNLLLREVNRGNLFAKVFATFLDKYYFMQTFDTVRKVYYGSQWGKPCIEDRAISDSLRNEIGLPPLKDEDFKDCSKQ
ncbi:MAG: hypothetical protein Q4A56_02415 [Porphyromonadaceae bacterium]|nr:hypothetical protein [Porphyromonadaceae bacterium]